MLASVDSRYCGAHSLTMSIFSVTFANPSSKGWNAKALPTYNGKVLISGSNGEQLSVPYLGKFPFLRIDHQTSTLPQC